MRSINPKWMLVLGVTLAMSACATQPKTKDELIDDRVSYMKECVEDADYDRSEVQRCKNEAESKYVIPVVNGRQAAEKCRAEVEKTTALTDSMSDENKDKFIKEWFACMENVRKYSILEMSESVLRKVNRYCVK